MDKDFFIVNCDTLINLNVEDFLHFHQKKKNILTMVVAIKKINIPYGVCTLNNNNHLTKIDEKPNKKFLANTGLYICNPKILNYLPKKNKFDMNDVIAILLKKKLKIGTFPVKDTDWKDTGNWMDYLRIIKTDGRIN